MFGHLVSLSLDKNAMADFFDHRVACTRANRINSFRQSAARFVQDMLLLFLSVYNLFVISVNKFHACGL